MIRGVIKYFLWVCLFGFSFGLVDYDSEIQPIFNNNCGNCHLGNSSGGLNLSSYTNVMDGGISGAVITPYNHTISELYNRITLPESSDFDMPASGSLSQSQIDLIAQWIDEGAYSDLHCTDPQAYNCEDDVWSCVDGGETSADCMAAGEWPNYTFLVGPTPYINGCNYDNTDPNDGNLPVYQEEGCESGLCEGYYNPDENADVGYGTCDYYQSIYGDDVEFTVEDNGINVDWSAFSPPNHATVIGYNIQRCTGGCDFITGLPFPWYNNINSYSGTSIFDEFDWETSLANCDDCGGQIKYAINVRYSNAEDYAMAIGASYVTPESSCPDMGDVNGDGGWNVLDIVTLANCVLAENCGSSAENWDGFDCGESEANPGTAVCYGCAADSSGDGGWNVLDIVLLANCVLAQNCGG